MRITESQLRRIVRQEASRLVEMGPRGVAPQSYAPGGYAPDFSYAKKLDYLKAARDELINAQVYETQKGSGDDPDLDNLLESLEGYIEAVQVMADQEG